MWASMSESGVLVSRGPPPPFTMSLTDPIFHFDLKHIPGEGDRQPWTLLLIVDHVSRFLWGFDLDDGDKTAADVRIISPYLYFRILLCLLVYNVHWYYISICLA